MNIIKRIICRWEGHNFNNNAEDGFTCERCGRSCDYHQFVTRECAGIYGLKDIIRAWRECLPRWWKCDECGKRFGRHDRTKEHLPF